MRRTAKALTLFAVAASLGVGCSSNDDRHDRPRDDDRDGIPNRADPHPNRPDVPVGDVYDHDHGGSRRVPREAVRLEKDEGREMHVRPNKDGRIYLYDPRAGRIAYDGRLHAKEEFVAEPDHDLVTIDGRRVEGVRLSPKVRYELYFLRD